MTNNLTFYRKKRGLTVDEVTKILNIPKSTIYKWEEGVMNPNLEKLQKLAFLYEIDIVDIYKNMKQTDFENELIKCINSFDIDNAFLMGKKDSLEFFLDCIIRYIDSFYNYLEDIIKYSKVNDKEYEKCINFLFGMVHSFMNSEIKNICFLPKKEEVNFINGKSVDVCIHDNPEDFFLSFTNNPNDMNYAIILSDNDYERLIEKYGRTIFGIDVCHPKDLCIFFEIVREFNIDYKFYENICPQHLTKRIFRVHLKKLYPFFKQKVIKMLDVNHFWFNLEFENLLSISNDDSWLKLMFSKNIVNPKDYKLTFNMYHKFLFKNDIEKLVNLYMSDSKYAGFNIKKLDTQLINALLFKGDVYVGDEAGIYDLDFMVELFRKKISIATKIENLNYDKVLVLLYCNVYDYNFIEKKKEELFDKIISIVNCDYNFITGENLQFNFIVDKNIKKTTIKIIYSLK